MHPPDRSCPGRAPAPIGRRRLLRAGATGFGWLAFSALARGRAFGAPAGLPALHHPARAKSVIFLFMDGGVSHVDTFDPKPALAQHDGKPATEDPARKWVRSPWSFARHGQSGLWVSELSPQIAGCADGRHPVARSGGRRVAPLARPRTRRRCRDRPRTAAR